MENEEEDGREVSGGSRGGEEKQHRKERQCVRRYKDKGKITMGSFFSDVGPKGAVAPSI